MTAQKSADAKASGQKFGTRKPWKKKTPVEVVLGEADRLRQQILDREEELKGMKRQLQKFEEARKIFETT
jgi:hypothetical protein